MESIKFELSLADQLVEAASREIELGKKALEDGNRIGFKEHLKASASLFNRAGRQIGKVISIIGE